MHTNECPPSCPHLSIFFNTFLLAQESLWGMFLWDGNLVNLDCAMNGLLFCPSHHFYIYKFLLFLLVFPICQHKFYSYLNFFSLLLPPHDRPPNSPIFPLDKLFNVLNSFIKLTHYSCGHIHFLLLPSTHI